MTNQATTDLDNLKRTVRLRALAARSGNDPAACGAALASHVLRDLPPPAGAIVSGFLPIGDEIDLRPLLQALHAQGHPIALPVTPKRGLPLTFRLWVPGGELIAERFGTHRPTGPECTPDFLLVPLLAFDAHGGRLGYGAGFYDRTLALLPGRFRLGCAFAAQQVDAVPVGPYDIRLDAVATESGIIRCGDHLRILFLGDVLGRTGRDTVGARLPGLRRELGIDLAVVNAENASHGFGLAPDMAKALFAAGADVITLGNHAWDRKEIIPYIAETPKLIRPLNYPPGTPGNGSVLITLQDGRKALVLQAMGRLFMDPMDCPFRGTAEVLSRYRLGASVNAIVADIHAEASSEKMAYAHTFDSQVSFVVGTHTHCPSADAQILPGGTAFQSDAGMCGDYDSVIGMVKEGATLRFWRKMPGEKLGPAEGEATVCGVFVETDDTSGLALRIEPVRIGGRLSQAMPVV